MKRFIYAAALVLALVPQTAYSVDSCRALFGIEARTGQSTRAKLETDLYFKEKDGKVEELSIREGNTAAHVYLDSTAGSDPYLFVAFSAGNSGVAFWFKSASNAFIESTSAPVAVQTPGGLNGIEIPLKTGSRELAIDDAILGSMRFIRDRELGPKILRNLGRLMDFVTNHKIIEQDGKLYFTRKGINGVTKYLSQIEPMGDTRIVKDGTAYRLVSSTEVKFKLTAMTSETPLTPISLKDFFTEDALKQMDPKRLLAFSFLAYKEKLMAGSPRYFSKFGRDSIYTLRVLMAWMKPAAIESLLAATINSMDPRTGLISHEQHEGDFASFVRMKNRKKYRGVTGPLEDYKMVDDDLAFTFVLNAYIQANPRRAKEFLQRQDARGHKRLDLVKRLFAHVERHAKPFADNPVYSNLVGLKGHEPTGQWRDSEAGLGGGKYPFDVNAAFMPAAIKALAELAMNPQLEGEFYDLNKASELTRVFEVWNTKVTPLFMVRIPKEHLEEYARSYFINSGRDLRTLPPAPNEEIVFPAIALGRDGRPIQIMHSDDSLMMTFGQPDEGYLKNVSQRLRLPFPYGLREEIGIVVANPIFAPDLQPSFTSKNYHGTVVWTMQEDLLVFGMARQISRSDTAVPDSLKNELKQNIRLIESLIAKRGDLGGIEVFSVRRENDGRVVHETFSGDAKGNSNQLWGHLRLVFPQLLRPLGILPRSP